MKAKLDLLLGRTSSFPKRVISLLKNHTFLQIQNLAKYKMCKLGGFNSKYLKYNPPYLLLFITNRCNLSCKFCPYHGPHRPSNYSLEFNDMSMDVFKWIISRFSHAVEVELGGGGEAFLHSHIFEMIDYAHKHRMRTRIPTNGLVLHEMLDKVTHSPLSHRKIFVDKSSPLPDFCKTCHGMVSQWRPVYLPDRKGIR